MKSQNGESVYNLKYLEGLPKDKGVGHQEPTRKNI